MLKLKELLRIRPSQESIVYEILKDERVIGTCVLDSQDSVQGFDSLLQSQVFKKEKMKTFLWLAKLQWMPEAGDVYLKEEDTFSTFEQFISCLSYLRETKHVDNILIPIRKGFEDLGMDQSLKGYGYKVLTEDHNNRFYMREAHLCLDCGVEWIPIQEKLCPTCDYQIRMDMEEWED